VADFSIHLERKGAYSFSQDALVQIWTAIASSLESEPKIAIKIAGGPRIESTSMKEVLEDSHVQHQLIEDVRYEGSSYKNNQSRIVWVHLKQSSWPETPVEIHISGDKNSTGNLRDELANIIEGQELWYSKFTIPDHPVYVVPALIVAVIAAMAISIALNNWFFPSLNSKESGGVVWFEAFFLLGAAFFLKARMFPKMIFEIGRSGRLGASARHWREVVGVGIILALLVGIATTYLTDRLFK
jgi:hypothetical protein